MSCESAALQMLVQIHFFGRECHVRNKSLWLMMAEIVSWRRCCIWLLLEENNWWSYLIILNSFFTCSIERKRASRLTHFLKYYKSLFSLVEFQHKLLQTKSCRSSKLSTFHERCANNNDNIVMATYHKITSMTSSWRHRDVINVTNVLHEVAPNFLTHSALNYFSRRCFD